MKKKLLFIFLFLFILCGCSSKQKEISCRYINDNNELMQSAMKVILTLENDKVIKEKLSASYTFKDAETASANYKSIEEVLEKDETVIIRQDKEKILASGEKDVRKQNYSLKDQVLYYEQLGYTCK